MAESRDSEQIRDALLTIRSRLARIRLEGAESMQRLAATRAAADAGQAQRENDKRPATGA